MPSTMKDLAQAGVMFAKDAFRRRRDQQAADGERHEAAIGPRFLDGRGIRLACEAKGSPPLEKSRPLSSEE
jgi:hypothetical protein